MKGYCKYRKPRVNYWGSSYLSERYGLKRYLQNRDKKDMPLKKNDLIAVYVPKTFLEDTGISEFDNVSIGVVNGDEPYQILFGRFIEYDELGGLWMSIFAIRGGAEYMIPRDVIVFIINHPSGEFRKKMGFSIPDEKTLDK